MAVAEKFTPMAPEHQCGHALQAIFINANQDHFSVVTDLDFF